MRHASDAILCGIGTVLDDNPLLTDRSGLARRRPLLRVVLDSALRLPLDSRLVESAQGDLLLYTTDARNARADALRKAGVEIEEVRTIEGGARVDLRAVLVSLGERRGVLNVLAEGGSRLNRVLLAEELVDKLCLFYAPMFLGEDGVPLVAGGGRLKPQLSGVSIGRSGEDFCFEAYLRDPWR
jgi:diaminohydroxyphosphoribosylaminopyrimidine deaminase/5-amino-6-(5-phosphoribosylamino)uracil reductase